MRISTLKLKCISSLRADETPARPARDTFEVRVLSTGDRVQQCLVRCPVYLAVLIVRQTLCEHGYVSGKGIITVRGSGRLQLLALKAGRIHPDLERSLAASCGIGRREVYAISCAKGRSPTQTCNQLTAAKHGHRSPLKPS